MFRHPKYYKELRKRNKTDPAISHANSTRGPSDVRSDPGQELGKVQPWDREATPSSKRQASSSKQQAKPEPSSGSQASSDKL